MPLYRASFERINFGITPPLKQTADVLLKTDIPYEDEHLDAFSEALWAAMCTQNPHWANSAGPEGATTGWSSVMGGHHIDLISEVDNLAAAWYIPARAWLKADGTDTTVDIDEAGRFTPDQILELQARYPGERYSMVMPKLLNTIYEKDGTAHSFYSLQLRRAEFVLWGEGPPSEQTRLRVSLANEPFLLGMNIPFKLPDHCTSGLPSQEYERRVCWAWRFARREGGSSDFQWALADSPEHGIAQAQEQALRTLRQDGSHTCDQWLATKHFVSIEDKTVVL